MPYRQPTQDRALRTEHNLLEALDDLLKEKSFEETSIAEIAERAGCTKSAFLKRFGTKEQSLFVLFSYYTAEASALMNSIIVELDAKAPLEDIFFDMSNRFDRLLQKHFSANRAMNEYFKRDLESHDLTKKIFGECIQMMMHIQKQCLQGGYTEAGAYSSAQLLVSIDFHYAMRAMPALPADPVQRHKLISEILTLAIKK
jgi:AcrR family transcriptional regulator